MRATVRSRHRKPAKGRPRGRPFFYFARLRWQIDPPQMASLRRIKAMRAFSRNGEPDRTRYAALKTDPEEGLTNGGFLIRNVSVALHDTTERICAKGVRIRPV